MGLHTALSCRLLHTGEHTIQYTGLTMNCSQQLELSIPTTPTIRSPTSMLASGPIMLLPVKLILKSMRFYK